MISLEQQQFKYFEEQVNLHHKAVLGYALSLNIDRHTAKDLVQEAFIVALRKLDKLDQTANFAAYVRGIVRLKYLEYMRKHKELCLGDDVIDIIERQFSHWQQDRGGRQELFSALEQCLNKLPDEQRQIVRRFYIERQSCSEIAVATELQETTVRKRLERLRRLLKDCIETK